MIGADEPALSKDRDLFFGELELLADEIEVTGLGGVKIQLGAVFLLRHGFAVTVESQALVLELQFRDHGPGERRSAIQGRFRLLS